MNEELQDRIAKYLDALEMSATNAGQFAIEQAPLVAQEYLAWCFYSALVVAVALLAAGSLGLGATFFACRRYVKGKDITDCPEIMLSIIPTLISACMVTASVERAAAALKVAVAPRVVLLEKVAELSR